MSLRRWFSPVALLPLLGLSSAVALAAPAPPPSCLAGHAVTRVVPHHAAVYAGQGPYQKLVGARLFVPAKPGLTAEWLHVELARRASASAAGDAAACPLDVPGVRIQVDSGGPGFWVSLGARDDAGAKEILRRAQALTR